MAWRRAIGPARWTCLTRTHSTGVPARILLGDVGQEELGVIPDVRGGGLKLVNIDTAVVAVPGPVDSAVLVPGDHVRVDAVHHLPLALHHQVGLDLEAVVARLV